MHEKAHHAKHGQMKAINPEAHPTSSEIFTMDKHHQQIKSSSDNHQIGHMMKTFIDARAGMREEQCRREGFGTLPHKIAEW